MTSLIYIAAVSFILILLAYTLYLYIKLYRVTKQNKMQHQQALHASQLQAFESIDYILEAYHAEQCELAEACLRIANLLDLTAAISWQSKFPLLADCFEELQSLSILEQRKALPKKQRMKEDLTRYKIEAKYSEIITNEFVELGSYIKSKLKELRSINKKP